MNSEDEIKLFRLASRITFSPLSNLIIAEIEIRRLDPMARSNINGYCQEIVIYLLQVAEEK